jgi:anti-sigma factor RsiW
MTTNTMTCDGFSDRLLAYLEHETDDTTRTALERHAVTCAECGALLADLRKLRIDASNLPELTPSRDLWSGIAARIEAPVVPIGTVQVDQRRSHVVRRWARGALIAASLAGAAGIGYFAASRRDVVSSAPETAQQQPETVYRVASSRQDSAAQSASTQRIAESRDLSSSAAKERRAAGTPVVPVSRSEVQRAVATMNIDYDREIARLRVLIDQRRNQMDPVTVAIIEKNLQVIDVAITECKKAIARDPSSRFLIESLNQSLQSKVELMRTAALLPTRT